ncbi:MAG: transporter substrate-binding domain-containing protein [Pseudomonadota bacterium]
MFWSENQKLLNLHKICFIAGILALSFALVVPAQAQQVNIPSFWDKNERFEKPDLSKIPRFRFLTTTDFPPFNFIDRKKRLSGFHIDLARAICLELEMLNRCQIQALPWEELQKTLKEGNGEAIIAGLAVTPEARKELSFSRPFLQIPARFVTRKDSGLTAPVFEALFRKKTGVIEGSAHKAYFENVFSARTVEVFPTRDAALKALQEKKVEAVFSDAVSLSFWLGSASANDCCTFLDGPFSSEKYFGNGLAIALPKERPELVSAVNFALSQINKKGTFAELYLRYFPMGLF